MAGKRDLVIVTAGDDSLHLAFAEGRDFDLWVMYYGDDSQKARRFAKGCDRFFGQQGLKWDLVRSLAGTHLDGSQSIFSGYRYIFLPDDDLAFPNGALDVSQLFESAADIDADVFQPAIANKHWSWEATVRRPDSHCRAVNIAEIMMPGYRACIFTDVILPLLHASAHIRAGWGLETLIGRFAEVLLRRPVRTFVLDHLPVVHTRAVGQDSPLHRIGHDELFLAPVAFGQQMRTYARFEDVGSAREFKFPFLADEFVASDIDAHLAWVRFARFGLRWRERLHRWLGKREPQR